MVRLLLLILVICAGLFIGPMLVDQKGYVLIAVNDWTVESSVVVMVMLILIFYAVLQFIEWGIVNGFSLWSRTRNWFGWRKHQLARQKTLSSLLDFAGGRFALAEKNSARYASLSDQPVLNYLTAANSAQRLGKKEQRDKYLDSAALIDSDDSALLATRLKLLIEDGDYQQAATWLASHEKSLEQQEILALALPVYQQTNQWQQALITARKLQKNKLINESQVKSIELQAHAKLLDEASDKDADEVQVCYDGFARKMRNHIDIFGHYAKLMIKLGRFCDVETAFYKQLRKKESATLVATLSLLPEDEAKRCSDKLTSVFGDHQDDVVFIETVAKLFTVQRQWELAKEWYVKALNLKQSANIYHQLAHAQQQLGEMNGALSSFNSALICPDK